MFSAHWKCLFVWFNITNVPKLEFKNIQTRWTYIQIHVLVFNDVIVWKSRIRRSTIMLYDKIDGISQIRIRITWMYTVYDNSHKIHTGILQNKSNIDDYPCDKKTSLIVSGLFGPLITVLSFASSYKPYLHSTDRCHKSFNITIVEQCRKTCYSKYWLHNIMPCSNLEWHYIP